MRTRAVRGAPKSGERSSGGSGLEGRRLMLRAWRRKLVGEAGSERYWLCCSLPVP
jgi:hypothetical protein